MPAVDRRRTGALVAAASSALLMGSMFLPWFGLDARVELPGEPGSATVEVARLNAFEAFGLTDVVLFVTACLGIALALRAFLPSLPDNPWLAVAAGIAAAVSALLIVYRLIDPPAFGEAGEGLGTATGRRIGAFFGLLGAAGLAWAVARREVPALADRPDGEPSRLE